MICKNFHYLSGLAYAFQGPCGIPALDEENFFPVFESNKELNLPINKAELETDFDFEANLALFDKDVSGIYIF